MAIEDRRGVEGASHARNAIWLCRRTVPVREDWRMPVVKDMNRVPDALEEGEGKMAGEVRRRKKESRRRTKVARGGRRV